MYASMQPQHPYSHQAFQQHNYPDLNSPYPPSTLKLASDFLHGQAPYESNESQAASTACAQQQAGLGSYQMQHAAVPAASNSKPDPADEPQLSPPSMAHLRSDGLDLDTIRSILSKNERLMLTIIEYQKVLRESGPIPRIGLIDHVAKLKAQLLFRLRKVAKFLDRLHNLPGSIPAQSLVLPDRVVQQGAEYGQPPIPRPSIGPGSAAASPKAGADGKIGNLPGTIEQDPKNPSRFAAHYKVVSGPAIHIGHFPSQEDAHRALQVAAGEMQRAGHLQFVLGHFPNQLHEDVKLKAAPRRGRPPARGRAKKKRDEEEDSEYSGSSSSSSDSEESSESEDSEDRPRRKKIMRRAPVGAGLGRGVGAPPTTANTSYVTGNGAASLDPESMLQYAHQHFPIYATNPQRYHDSYGKIPGYSGWLQQMATWLEQHKQMAARQAAIPGQTATAGQAQTPATAQQAALQQQMAAQQSAYYQQYYAQQYQALQQQQRQQQSGNPQPGQQGAHTSTQAYNAQALPNYQQHPTPK